MMRTAFPFLAKVPGIEYGPAFFLAAIMLALPANSSARDKRRATLGLTGDRHPEVLYSVATTKPVLHRLIYASIYPRQGGRLCVVPFDGGVP